MRVSLTPHPQSPPGPVSSIEIDVDEPSTTPPSPMTTRPTWISPFSEPST